MSWIRGVGVTAVAAVLGCGGGKVEGRDRPVEGQVTVRDAGFATPESILHDPLTDVYYVASINGPPAAVDDNGFITVVSAEGRVLAPRWIDAVTDSVTLDAPKGMAVAGPFLYVADIATIRRFDRRTGGPRGEIVIPGATFLNDLTAADDGTLYFTDSGLRPGADGLEPSGTDAVSRLRFDGTLDTLARGEMLGRPNGIAVSGDSVWVVNQGGELFRVANGGKVDVITLPTGGLDGLVVFNGDAFVSSWEGRVVYRGKIGGPFREMLTGLDAPADIGHDRWRHRLLVPLFQADEVRLIPLAM